VAAASVFQVAAIASGQMAEAIDSPPPFAAAPTQVRVGEMGPGTAVKQKKRAKPGDRTQPGAPSKVSKQWNSRRLEKSFLEATQMVLAGCLDDLGAPRFRGKAIHQDPSAGFEYHITGSARGQAQKKVGSPVPRTPQYRCRRGKIRLPC